MIQSMTGYGRGECAAEGRRITAEIKSVNHRYNEIQVKLPRRYGPLEEKLRQRLAISVSRGKTDLFIKEVINETLSQDVRVNHGLAKRYQETLQGLAEDLSLPLDLGVAGIIALPGVLAVEDTEEGLEEAWGLLIAPVDMALSRLIEMRKVEGNRLAEDFRQRLTVLEGLRQGLLGYADSVVDQYRQRLTARIAELTGQPPVDESRIAQEVAIIADKASVDEELVRLDSHFRQFRELLDDNQPIGRKLDFLCQEINREINTVGSKANDLSMTKVVVEMKSELEKLREQVQNIQ